MKQITVCISKNDNDAVSDWNAAHWCHSLTDGERACVATATMLNELRVAVSHGEIAPFEFEFEGETIAVGEKGELNKWPIGFFEHQAVQVHMLMRGKEYSRENAIQHIADTKERRYKRKVS